MILSRRRLLMLGSAGAASLALPGWAQGLTSGFTHGVASGEPGPDQILLWTRYVSTTGAVRLTAEISPTEDFAHVAGGGTAHAAAENDHTAKIVIGGLKPNQWYYYRFIAPDGAKSQTGRTRTLPVGDVASFNLGVFSCSNLPVGFFNAYAHAAARDDLDLLLHLGDYFYEYERGHYPTIEEAIPGRIIEPATETIHLADYRARFASYRRDRNLQEIHRRFPMIVMWDDHESANDSWRDGAQNHDPGTEGEWSVRKAAAIKAYREWMPVSDDYWAEYRIGNLATLFKPEERLTARTHQVDLIGAADQANLQSTLKAFRDTVWMDPSHTLFGTGQEQWFARRMSVAAKETRWQVLAQQVNVGLTYMPSDAANWVAPNAAASARRFVDAGIASAALGMPFNMDSWNGYPAARSRMLRNGLDVDANLIILSGDSHNAWAFDLAEQGVAAGVEFGGQSVTSPGYESSLSGIDPATVAKAMVASSPELKWADTSNRGYMTISLTPEAARGEWLFMETIRQPSTAIKTRHQVVVQAGARRLST